MVNSYEATKDLRHASLLFPAHKRAVIII